MTARAYLPERRTLLELRRASSACKGCDLWRRGTQTVFGEGPARASLMLVGEQPGDQEDIEGRPFVGPAGRLLDRALQDAGIDRRDVYVTNVVKHFKWKARGKRRIHDKPSWTEVQACFPWLESEVQAVRPRVLAPMGATAAQALLGRDFKVTERRGEVLESHFEPAVVATVHPSSVLRAQSDTEREAQLAALTNDLRVVAGALRATAARRETVRGARR